MDYGRGGEPAAYPPREPGLQPHPLYERFRPLLAELLSGYAARGGTVVLGTHDLDLAVSAKARTFSLD